MSARGNATPGRGPLPPRALVCVCVCVFVCVCVCKSHAVVSTPARGDQGAEAEGLNMAVNLWFTQRSALNIIVFINIIV